MGAYSLTPVFVAGVEKDDWRVNLVSRKAHEEISMSTRSERRRKRTKPPYRDPIIEECLSLGVAESDEDRRDVPPFKHRVAVVHREGIVA